MRRILERMKCAVGCVPRLALFVFVATMALSCVDQLRTVRLYDGAVRPDDQVARLVVPFPMILEEIDGKTGLFSGASFLAIDLQPGEHTVRLSYKETFVILDGTLTTTAGPREFEFYAEPGMMYQAYAIKKKDKIGLFLLGPFPLSLEIPGTERKVYMDRSPGSEAGDITDNFCYTVEDGETITHYMVFLEKDQVPFFSDDLEHVAFFVYGGHGNYQWIVDGLPTPLRHEKLQGGLVFSCDGSRYAYLASDGDTNKLVVDGKVAESFSTGVEIHPWDIDFSPNGRHMVYSFIDGGRSRIFLDGEEMGPFQEFLPPAFSKSTGRSVLLAKKDERWRLYVDGEEETLSFENRPPGNIVFSSDDSKFAYIVKLGGDRRAVAFDGSVGRAFHRVASPMFSPDDKHFVYTGLESLEGGVVLMVDGKQKAQFDDLDPDTLAFGDDSETVFMKAKVGGKWMMREINLTLPTESSSEEE